MKFDKALSYQDIYLIPRYSELSTRSEANTKINFLGKTFKSPWLPANMSSVIDRKVATWLSENGYFYIYHRFDDTLEFVYELAKERYYTNSNIVISISVGVGEKDKAIIQALSSNHKPQCPDFITIDVAHGHHILVKEMIEHIKNSFKGNQSSYPCPKIIAGNVATIEGVEALYKWGADAAKVGIAGGGACSTKNMTGFHVPMFSCVNNIYMIQAYNSSPFAFFPIIADGGIKENGDISKALVAGASMVMAGSLFASCIDAPSELVKEHDKDYKVYYGSASSKQKGHNNHVEGFETKLLCNGLTYEEKYAELTQSLKSAISYSGGKDLYAFKEVEWLSVK